MCIITVNSEIFARVLFSRNFDMHSFVKIKSSRIGEITLSFTHISKSHPCCEFLMSQICVLTLFAKIKFSRKFPNLQYELAFLFFHYRLHWAAETGVQPDKSSRDDPRRTCQYHTETLE